MPVGKKIRVYDLAREVKQDTKRVMEDLRREGADISVPSNSVSAELADKVRNKYFPKAEASPKRGIKIIKAGAAKKDDVHEAEAETPTAVPVEEPAPEVVTAAQPTVEAEPVPDVVEAPVEEAPKSVKVKRLVATKPKEEPVAEVET